MYNKFNLLTIIGIEGVGHHLFENACDGLTENPYKELHKLIIEYFSIDTFPDRQLEIEADIYTLTANNIGCVCKESASFPYGRPVHILNSYNILSFYELFSRMPHVNLYFIVLTRNIIHSTLSSKVRFDPEKSIIYNVRLQEQSLNHINNQIQLIPNDKYIIVELTNIIDNIRQFTQLINERSGIYINFNINKIVRTDINKYLKHKDYQYLVDYFSDNRLKQFDFIKNNTYLFK